METPLKPKRKRGGKGRRQKGSREELRLVKLLQVAGFAAEKMPLSGSMRGKFGGCDITMPLMGRDLRVEVKHHARAFGRIYKWLEPVDMLTVRADHQEALVIMPLRTAVELFSHVEKTFKK